MVKDSGDPFVEHGKPVTVMSEPFKPARPDGTAKVSFIIDTTNLDGKELVAFENCYRLGEFKKGDDVSKADKTVVADHKDLNDEGQTVKVSKTAKSVPPKMAVRRTLHRSIRKHAHTCNKRVCEKTQTGQRGC